MEPYTANPLSPKAYRQLTQLSVKEMRLILMIILAVLTAALQRNMGTTGPTTIKQQSFKTVIECVQYLTHFALL